MDYYHLGGTALAVGSVIEPGNWGRILRALSWRHGRAIHEQALEDARIRRFPHRPSRLDSAFVFLSVDDAREFRDAEQGFRAHILYRVSLRDPNSISHVSDWRLCNPQGTFRNDWADVYWMDLQSQANAIPGIDWQAVTKGLQTREMLTLSQLRVEERFNS